MKIRSLLKKNPYLKKILLNIYHHTYTPYKTFRKNRLFRRYAVEALFQADKAFKKLGVTYWLDFGTLLGAYRNKDFIPYDLDLDFGMFLNDYTPKIEKIFTEMGFKKKKEFLIEDGKYGREESYSFKGVNVDIFFFTSLNKKYAYYHDFVYITKGDENILVPREITLPLERIGEIEFKGRIFPAPFPLEKHLASRYGNNFMIEDRNWKIGKEGGFPNIKLLKDKKFVVRILK